MSSHSAFFPAKLSILNVIKIRKSFIGLFFKSQKHLIDLFLWINEKKNGKINKI